MSMRVKCQNCNRFFKNSRVRSGHARICSRRAYEARHVISRSGTLVSSRREADSETTEDLYYLPQSNQSHQSSDAAADYISDFNQSEAEHRLETDHNLEVDHSLEGRFIPLEEIDTNLHDCSLLISQTNYAERLYGESALRSQTWHEFKDKVTLGICI
jgi:hypothetical protein